MPIPPAPTTVIRRAERESTQALELGELALAADRLGGGRGNAPALGRAAVHGGEIERGILEQDQPLELAQLGARIEPELLPERSRDPSR